MEKLDAILQAHVAQGQDTADKLLGAAFVVAGRDGTIYSGSAGRIGFDTTAPPFTPASFTWIASATKLLTTTCIMQLVERGAIALDDDVRNLVPELGRLQILRGFDAEDKPILEDTDKIITLRMLLNHTLGLGTDMADPDLMKWSASIGRTTNIMSWSRAGITTPLKFAPGEAWYYGAATDWAGLVLEKVAGTTLGAYMQQHVLEPLGMRDTGFWPAKLPQTKDRAAAYAVREGRTLTAGEDPTPRDHEMESGGSGLFTTAADYGVFLTALLQGKLLEEETLAQVFMPQLNEAQSGMLEFIAYNIGYQDAFAPEFPKDLKLNFGLCGVINMEDVPGKRRKGSLMWSGMPNSRWWIDRESGVGAVLITNVQPHGDPVVKSLYSELELAVYEHLVPK